MFISIPLDEFGNAVFARADTDFGREVIYVAQTAGEVDLGIVQLDGSAADPTNLTEVDGDLFFSGRTNAEGREPRFIRVVPEPGPEALALAALLVLGMLRVRLSRRL